MIRLERLEVRGFRGWRAGELELAAPLVLVVGANGCGKSSTLNAVEWCLFGREVEKKDSGLEERGDWEAPHRGAPEEPLEVALTFATPEGPWRLTRRRPAAAGARAEDELVLELPDGEQLAGATARARLETAGFPDWDTWHRAHCQHQERVRRRLTESRDRSKVLSALLGLEPYDELRGALEAPQPARRIRELDEELGALEKELLARLARPAEELEESESRLTALGLARTRLGPGLALELAGGLLERARALEARAGLTTELPSCDTEADLPELLRWAEAWASGVRGRLDLAGRLAAQTRRRAAIEGELERLRPAEERWRRARAQLDEGLRTGGDEAARERSLAECEAARREVEERLRREDAARALLREARELLRSAEDPARCPVCTSHVPELAARLDGELAGGRASGATSTLEAERERLGARREALAGGLRELRGCARDEGDARAQLERVRSGLAAQLPPARLESVPDPVAAARAELDETDARLRGLERAVAELDADLDAHRRAVEQLRELGRWGAAARRAEQQADLRSTPGWDAVQRALDEAAGYAVDLQVLADMARELQEERSAQRAEEVGAGLGRYLSLLCEGAGEGASKVRVQVRRTAKGLHYDLADTSGARALPILNQAAMNALSLALLFAQAESRAQAGAPSWVVLDDPGQSLDPEHQRGLARAIERLAESAPVLVAAPPGPLADELARPGGLPRRVVRLGAWDPARGVRVEGEQAL